MPYWFEPTSTSVEIGGRTMTLETGKIAKQAAGSVTVTFGDTVVLVTAVHSKPRAGIDFFPLTVDFVEKFAAAGKIPGGFFKREGRLADREVLVSRFIDRSIRPLFADGYNDETQVTATVLSHDPEFSADMCAFVGASAALSISDMPFLGPIAAVRIARVEGDYIINPVPEDLEESDLELIVAGNAGSIVMVEGGAKQLPEDEILAALKHAHGELQPIIETIEKFAKKVGKAKLVMPAAADNSELEGCIAKMASDRLSEAFQIKEKKARATAVKAVETEIRQEIWDEYRNEKIDVKTLADFEARANGLKALQTNVKNILHDLGGATVDCLHPGIQVCAGDGKLDHVPVPTMQLDAHVDDPAKHLGCPPFGLGGLFDGEFPFDVLLDEPVDEYSADVDFRLRLGQLETVVLETTDGPAERFTVLGVVEG